MLSGMDQSDPRVRFPSSLNGPRLAFTPPTAGDLESAWPCHHSLPESSPHSVNGIVSYPLMECFIRTDRAAIKVTRAPRPAT
jgi:hypothetical protein